MSKAFTFFMFSVLLYCFPVYAHRACHSYKILAPSSVHALKDTFSSIIDNTARLRGIAANTLTHFADAERFLNSGSVYATPYCQDINEYVVKRSLPPPFIKECGLQYITDSSQLQLLDARSVFINIDRFAKVIQSLAPSVLPSYRLSWASSFSAMVSTFDAADKYRECTLAKSYAYRVRHQGKNVWGVAADITNISVFGNSREVLSELVFSI